MSSSSSSSAAHNATLSNARRQEGNAHFAAGRFLEAIKSYTTAMSYDADNAKLYTNRALCFIRLREWDRAMEDSRHALRLDRASVKAQYYLGQALLAVGSDEEGAEELRRATVLAVEQRLDFGDDIWALCRKAKQKIWDKKEAKRIAQEIELSEYLRRLIVADKEARLAEAGRSMHTATEAVKQRIVDHCEEKLAEVAELFKQNDERRRKRTIPDYFLGKISCDIMVDPVITPSGITYERKCIAEHIRVNGPYDPITRAKVKESQLVPNIAVREAIEEFFKLNPWAYDY